MKTIFLLLCLFSGLSLSAQNFIDTTKTWSVAQCGGWFCDYCYTQTYCFTGDTAIGQHTYKILGYSTDSVPASWTATDFLREDSTGKVYHLSSFGNEVLLYDFSLAPGDTFVSQMNCQPMVVDSVKPVVYEGVPRMTWYFDKPGKNKPETWIEGIGNEFGPLLHLAFSCWADYCPTLICYKESDTLRYFDYDYDDCYYTSVGMNELHANQVLVYPNPGSGRFTVRLENLHGDKRIRIYSLAGVLVKDVSAAGSSVTLDGILPGSYLVLVETQEGRYYSRLVSQ